MWRGNLGRKDVIEERADGASLSEGREDIEVADNVDDAVFTEVVVRFANRLKEVESPAERCCPEEDTRCRMAVRVELLPLILLFR